MPAAKLPHQFSQLRGGDIHPFLFAGAGLSFDLVPLPQDLLTKMQASVEAKFGCVTVADPKVGHDLYIWADQVFEHLIRVKVPLPKLEFARALGLLDDPRWIGNVGVALSGSMPRHRVIARLARERRFGSVWSVNWDCHIENALEEIGFNRDDSGVRQPWPTKFKAIVIEDDFDAAGHAEVLYVYKPHGCIRAILEADRLCHAGRAAQALPLSERFKVTATELKTEGKTQADNQFFIKLSADMATHPMLIAGWSISEPYLQKIVNTAVRRGVVERFTVLDQKFREGHQSATEVYDLTQAQVFTELIGGLSFDTFFLWLQTNYSLDRLKAFSDGVLLADLELLSREIANPPLNCWQVEFTDSFLPAWIRFCWRAGTVQCRDFARDKLRLSLAEEHIPLDIPHIERPDIESAAALMATIAPVADGFDFTMFKGALWEKARQRVIVPFPTWNGAHDLSALGPLVNELQKHAAFISELHVLPIDGRYPLVKPDPKIVDHLRYSLASIVSVPKFSVAEEILLAEDILNLHGAHHV